MNDVNKIKLFLVDDDPMYLRLLEIDFVQQTDFALIHLGNSIERKSNYKTISVWVERNRNRSRVKHILTSILKDRLSSHNKRYLKIKRKNCLNYSFNYKQLF